MGLKALVIGGTGPTGPYVVAGLLQRGYDVTIMHSGQHEVRELPDVRHVHVDVHFEEPFKEGLDRETFCDKIAALTIVYGVLGALFHQQRTGEGQEIEVPMFESLVSFNLVGHIAGRVFEPPAGPTGYARLLSPFRRPFRTERSHRGL